MPVPPMTVLLGRFINNEEDDDDDDDDEEEEEVGRLR